MRELYRVKCINNNRRSLLTVGKVYDVIASNGKSTCVTNDSGYAAIYLNDRFEKYVENTKYKCINNVNEIHLLTIGKIYEQISGYEKGIRITADNGRDYYFSDWRFELVEEKSFKVGDRVTLKNGKAGILTITKIDGNVVTLKELSHTLSLQDLELCKPFTQNDLEIGMLVEYDYGDVYNVTTTQEVVNWKTNKRLDAIFKLNSNGDYIKMWQREEIEYYTLQCPLTDNYYGRKLGTDQLGTQSQKYIDNLVDKSLFHFTQDQIDAIPNQEFVIRLIKEKVR